MQFPFKPNEPPSVHLDPSLFLCVSLGDLPLLQLY
jgi:hypothetical protein